MLPSVFLTKQTAGSTVDRVAVLTAGEENTEPCRQVGTRKGWSFFKVNIEKKRALGVL